jgi:hypothetical protein
MDLNLEMECWLIELDTSSTAFGAKSKEIILKITSMFNRLSKSM